MRKAYLKRFAANTIKGRLSRQPTRGIAWASHEAKIERAEELGRGEIEYFDSTGKKLGEGWKGGTNPRTAVVQKMTEQMLSCVLLEQTDRSQKRKQYNKVVLSATEKSTVTMYFSGSEVFLIEDYPDGTFRQSLQSSSTTRMKLLFQTNRVHWL